MIRRIIYACDVCGTEMPPEALKSVIFDRSGHVQIRVHLCVCVTCIPRAEEIVEKVKGFRDDIERSLAQE